jgi:DNA-binding CsgD family transcriptional regulator
MSWPGDVIGRDGELGYVAALLAQLADGPAAVVFAGEPGIGKTTVLLAAAERARAASAVVLSAHPVEAEAELGFAALADLLAPVVDELLPALPEPQRHALAVVLLLEEPGRPLDQRAVCAATLSGLRMAAARGPVMLAIDDLQWLDASSARVLDFALRRLGGLPVGVVACQRAGAGNPPADDAAGVRLDLGRALPAGRCARHVLGPLSLGALQQVLKRELGRSFPHRTLARIARVAGGNPFYALELARCLPEDLPGAADLTLPEDLRRVVEDRLAGLPGRTREALLLAAVAASPTVELVRSAASPGTTPEDPIEAAVAAGIVTLEGAQVRFAHPLFAAGLYSSASPGQRRLAHRRLVPLITGIEEQARHRALGAEGPEEGVAGALDAAAEHARRRGAPEVAADLAEHARVLTSLQRSPDRQRRTIKAAEYRFHAGQLRHGRELLEAVLAEEPEGLVRAGALRLLGEIHYNEDSFDKAVAALQQALGHAGDDRGLRLTIELSLTFAMVSRADFAGAADHAGRALALADLGADPASVAEALAVAAMAGCLLGHGIDQAKVETALRLEDPFHQVPALVRPSLIAAHLALYEGRLGRCEQLLLPLRERILEQGEEGELPVVSYALGWSACWRGDLELAGAYAQEAIETAARIESDSLRCQVLGFAAVTSAYRGETALTKARAGEAIALAARTGYGLAVRWASWALAILALSQDDPLAADAALAPLAAPFETHIPEPILAFFVPDEIEALIGLGRLDRAAGLTEAFEEAAGRHRRPWALMRAARCRALLLAARGDGEGAAAKAGEAVGRCAGLELAIESARTLLVAGQIERRQRRKTVAAGYLRRAQDAFEQMGAALWAERARTELARVGLRRSAPAQLTSSEQRVAELAAAGRTNREVAAQLFISPKTVEANLARIYRKVGVRSRAELGAQLATTRFIGSQPPQT